MPTPKEPWTLKTVKLNKYGSTTRHIRVIWIQMVGLVKQAQSWGACKIVSPPTLEIAVPTTLLMYTAMQIRRRM